MFEMSKPWMVQRSSSLMPLVFCSLGPKRPMTLPHCSVSAPTRALKSLTIMTVLLWSIGDSGLKQCVECFSLSCCLSGSCLGFHWCICCDDGGVSHMQLYACPQDSRGYRMEYTPSVLPRSGCTMAKDHCNTVHTFHSVTLM